MYEVPNSDKRIYNVLAKNVKSKTGIVKTIKEKETKYVGLNLNGNEIVIVPDFTLKSNEKLNKFRNNKVWSFTLNLNWDKYEKVVIQDVVKSTGYITAADLEYFLNKYEKEVEEVEPLYKSDEKK